MRSERDDPGLMMPCRTFIKVDNQDDILPCLNNRKVKHGAILILR